MKQKRKQVLSRSILVTLGIPSIFFPGMVLASVLGWNWKNDLGKLGELGGLGSISRGKGSFLESKIIFPGKAVVTKVLDGDTFEIDNGETVRMIGINAPDRGSEENRGTGGTRPFDAAQGKGYQEAKDYLADLIEGREVNLEYEYYQDDKFARVLADVWVKCTTALGCKDGKRLVNWVMVKKKLATVVTYEDRRKLKYEDILREAEK